MLPLRRSGCAAPAGGLGIIEVKDRPARMGRNPATDAAVQITASRTVAFRVAGRGKRFSARRFDHIAGADELALSGDLRSCDD